MPLLNINKSEGLRLFVTNVAAFCAALSFSLLVTNTDITAQETVSREFQIKAVFLYNFTQFVQWPSHAFNESGSPLVIGILGNDPFGSFLDQTVRADSAEGHPLIIERYSSVKDLKDCHVLFISVANRSEMIRALEQVRAKPVLTVSDMEGFARQGGMIRLYNKDAHIRLRINMAAVDESGLIISSKLLRLAEVISAKVE